MSPRLFYTFRKFRPAWIRIVRLNLRLYDPGRSNCYRRGGRGG